jgi:hypothetical protein
MSSATLTDTRRHRRQAQRQAAPAAHAADASTTGAGLRPWHFFLLAGLMLSVVTVVVMRGQDPASMAVAALTAASAGLAGYGCYRTLRPLAGDGIDDRQTMIGGRTRAALERDKMLTLRSIKELEFDRAMGKVAEGDFVEMRDRLRARALRLLTQLEGPSAYRTAIERDVADRLPKAPPLPPGPRHEALTCKACGAVNEGDARFCKMCGSGLRALA